MDFDRAAVVFFNKCARRVKVPGRILKHKVPLYKWGQSMDDNSDLGEEVKQPEEKPSARQAGDVQDRILTGVNANVDELEEAAQRKKERKEAKEKKKAEEKKILMLSNCLKMNKNPYDIERTTATSTS